MALCLSIPATLYPEQSFSVQVLLSFFIIKKIEDWEAITDDYVLVDEPAPKCFLFFYIMPISATPYPEQSFSV
jgi:hypothetical protein